MTYKATVYWAIRAVLPEHGYEPVDALGRVFGFTCCLPEAREKVCDKRRSDYIRQSLKDTDKTPIWC